MVTNSTNMINIFNHMKLWVAVARHNFMWVNITRIEPAQSSHNHKTASSWSNRQAEKAVQIPLIAVVPKTFCPGLSCTKRFSRMDTAWDEMHPTLRLNGLASGVSEGNEILARAEACTVLRQSCSGEAFVSRILHHLMSFHSNLYLTP